MNLRWIDRTQKVDLPNAADFKFLVSATFAGATWVADLALWLQVAATSIAIVAGIAAAWYHIERAWELRRQRKIRQRDNSE